MINNVTYISYRDKEPLMEGLGMTLTCVDKSKDFNKLLKQIQNSRFIIAYISEEVYSDYKLSVDSWHGQGLFLSVMSTGNDGKSLGKHRIKDLLSSVSGIKKG